MQLVDALYYWKNKLKHPLISSIELPKTNILNKKPSRPRDNRGWRYMETNESLRRLMRGTAKRKRRRNALGLNLECALLTNKS